MGEPGPSTQAARALRAARRAAGEAARSAPESASARPRAPFSPRGRRAEEEVAEEEEGGEDETEEEESSEEESSGEEDEDEEGGEEKPPIHHYEIWRKLLRKSRKSGLRYVNGQPERGNDPMDVTAVESTQTTWDMSDRRHWPELLRLWARPTTWINPAYEVGVMKYKGRVVLDTHDQPIRDFPLPVTVSSVVEGLRIEAWTRSDTRLSLGDIEARVWTKVVDGKRVPAFDKRVLSKRASNARTRASLISWLQKPNREQQTELLDNRRTQAQKDGNLAADTDLTSAERAQYALYGLKKDKKSQAPTREKRINRLERRARTGGAVAGPSSGAVDAEPSDPVAPASGDDDNLTDDTDGDDAVQAPQFRDQASGDDTSDERSLDSSLIDPSDSRNDEPQNPQEEALLRDALESTVEEFRFLTGQEPVLTNPGDNYYSQWAMLQEQFRIVWTAAGNTDEAPLLRSVSKWTGGISQYGFAEMEEAQEAEAREAEAQQAEAWEAEAREAEAREAEAWEADFWGPEEAEEDESE